MEDRIRFPTFCGYVYGERYGEGSKYFEPYFSIFYEGYSPFDGYEFGRGESYGRGNGDGSGYGGGILDCPNGEFKDGFNFGCGYKCGSGHGVSMFNGNKVYIIDETPTIIENIRDNISKGYILNIDFTLTPTFIVKEDGVFAHGENLHEAFAALKEKLYNHLTKKERIGAFKRNFRDFNKKIPAIVLFYWHHFLTGSCKQGRVSFCKNHNIDLNKDEYTVNEFIELTKNSYGGDVIKKLK